MKSSSMLGMRRCSRLEMTKCLVGLGDCLEGPVWGGGEVVVGFLCRVCQPILLGGGSQHRCREGAALLYWHGIGGRCCAPSCTCVHGAEASIGADCVSGPAAGVGDCVDRA